MKPRKPDTRTVNHREADCSMGQGTARTSGSAVTMTNAKSVHAEKVNIYRSLTIVMGSYVRGAYCLRAMECRSSVV